MTQNFVALFLFVFFSVIVAQDKTDSYQEIAKLYKEFKEEKKYEKKQEIGVVLLDKIFLHDTKDFAQKEKIRTWKIVTKSYLFREALKNGERLEKLARQRRLSFDESNNVEDANWIVYYSRKAQREYMILNYVTEKTEYHHRAMELDNWTGKIYGNIISKEAAQADLEEKMKILKAELDKKEKFHKDIVKMIKELESRIELYTWIRANSGIPIDQYQEELQKIKEEYTPKLK